MKKIAKLLTLFTLYAKLMIVKIKLFYYQS